MMEINPKRFILCKHWLLVAVLFSTGLFAAINPADEFEIEKITEEKLSAGLKSALGHDVFAISVDFAFPSAQETATTGRVKLSLPGFANETVILNAGTTNKSSAAGISEKLLTFVKANGLLNVPQKSLKRRTNISLFLQERELASKEKKAVGFIQKVLYLDIKNGDKIRVLRNISLPNHSTNRRTAPVKKASASVKKQLKKEVNRSFDKPATKQPPLANQTEKAQSSPDVISNSNYKGGQMLNDYLPEILIAAFLLVIFIVLLTFFWLATRQISRNQKLQEVKQEGNSIAVEKVRHDTSSQLLSQTIPAAKQPINNPLVDEDRKSNLSSFRQEIVALGLGHPNLVKTEGSHLWTEDRMDTIVALDQLMGRSVFQSVFGKMDLEKIQRIQEFNNEKSLSAIQQEALVKAFYENLVSLLLNKPSRKKNQVFRFLENMNNNQILYLLKDQSVRVRALVLSQLPAHIAADILHAMDEEQSAAVAFELAQFESFPIKTFQDIASSLARKAENVPSFNNLQTEGISIITDMLGNMSLAEERKMLRGLRRQNPELHQRLRKRYYSFDDLARTPKHILSNVLPMLEQKCLATALIASEDDLYTRVIDALPSSFSNGLIDEIEVMQNEVTPEEIEEARKVVVSRIRAMIATGRFAMSALEELD